MYMVLYIEYVSSPCAVQSELTNQIAPHQVHESDVYLYDAMMQ